MLYCLPAVCFIHVTHDGVCHHSADRPLLVRSQCRHLLTGCSLAFEVHGEYCTFGSLDLDIK
eukprot:6287075-Ditylum_brightwellii.AAC.1